MKRNLCARQQQAAVIPVLLALSACAGPIQGGTMEEPSEMSYMRTPDGCMVAAGTVGNSYDSSFTYAAKYCIDPETGQVVEVKDDGSFGTTVTGDIARAFWSGTGAALAGGGLGVLGKAIGSGGSGIVNNTYAGATALQQLENTSSTDTDLNLCGEPCM